VGKASGAAWGRIRRRQCAALPISEQAGVRLVLLITTRGRRRWGIPKGWAEKGVAPHALAAREAFEEAGLLGEALAEPIGAYSYRKRLPCGRRRRCEVAVFALAVERRAKHYPERGQRKQRWVPIERAAELVAEPALASMLLGLRQ
jgi:8-oxo-dGTP pyrophosphatase MutT (NUDIX family)